MRLAGSLGQTLDCLWCAKSNAQIRPLRTLIVPEDPPTESSVVFKWLKNSIAIMLNQLVLHFKRDVNSIYISISRYIRWSIISLVGQSGTWLAKPFDKNHQIKNNCLWYWVRHNTMLITVHILVWRSRRISAIITGLLLIVVTFKIIGKLRQIDGLPTVSISQRAG